VGRWRSGTAWPRRCRRERCTSSSWDGPLPFWVAVRTFLDLDHPGFCARSARTRAGGCRTSRPGGWRHDGAEPTRARAHARAGLQIDGQAEHIENRRVRWTPDAVQHTPGDPPDIHHPSGKRDGIGRAARARPLPWSGSWKRRRAMTADAVGDGIQQDGPRPSSRIRRLRRKASMTGSGRSR